jgi:long-chain acyl-CoA synthetase
MANRAGALFHQARFRPDKVAVHCQGASLTFGQLAGRVRRAAGGLAALGVGHGSHVGLMLPSTVDFIVAQQALFALGAVVTPLNIHYRAGELRHAAIACQLSAIITLADYAALCAETGVTIIRMDDAGDALSLPYASARSRPLDNLRACRDHEPAMLLLTSATTGKAKGVVLTQANLAANYDRTPAWLGLDEQSTILCALPLYNTFGLNQGINAMLLSGATMVLLPRFDAGACIAAMASYGCNFMPAVPTMLQMMLDHPDAASGALSSLRLIMTGGAPVPASLLARLLKATHGARVLSGYGLTEATALVTLSAVELDTSGQIARPRSIGRVLDGMELAIMDADGALLPPMATGEIAVRGPNVMQAYFNAPQDTATALRDGWLMSGDIGYKDAEGYAYIVDRKKDVIIRGGQNIFPADIEEALYDAGVAEAAVIGTEDALMGEVPVAYVAGGSAQSLGAEGLSQHCRTLLASYKLPSAIHILPELPKGPTGKILRRALRNPAIEVQA